MRYQTLNKKINICINWSICLNPRISKTQNYSILIPLSQYLKQKKKEHSYINKLIIYKMCLILSMQKRRIKELRRRSAKTRIITWSKLMFNRTKPPNSKNLYEM